MKSSNIVCRKAREDDDISAIARYIHLTDPYIYPSICKDPDDPFWVRLIADCYKTKGNLFSVENLSVALAEERVVGVACVIPCGTGITFCEHLKLSPEDAERLLCSVSGYFRPLIEESMAFEGYNLTNLCIDEACRGHGVGEALMRHCLELYGRETMHLDVIADNASALRLYQKMGFEIETEYDGFSGTDAPLLCYHMVRKC